MPRSFLVAFNRTRGAEIASQVVKAADFASRSRGLLGRDAMAPREGMWIVPCAMIHTFFMRFPIDVIFLDRDLNAVKVMENLKPWRLSPWVLGAHSVLELAGGSLKGRAARGDRVEFRG